MDQDQLLKQTATPLIAETLPLQGRHLIEASAGTGKTFNITRIYLRMLLERKISVENILVMTFTKAATEEIRGRIDEFLRDALANWQAYTADSDNSFFYQLRRNLQVQQVSDEQVRVLIKSALINLDEAAIYTIHGFCKRVLSQQAFASGLSFNAQMEADDNELVLQACQDYYRILAKSATISDYSLFVEHWPSPQHFLSNFKSLLYDPQLPTTNDKQSLQQSIVFLAKQSEQHLLANESTIYEVLIDSKKGKSREQRITEFEQLLQFTKLLQLATTDVELCIQALPDFKFIGANRFAKSPLKAQLKVAFKPMADLKKIVEGFGNALLSARAYNLVLNAVKSIKQRVAEKKQQQNLLNFDDLISVLAQALNDQQKGQNQPLTAALLDQYPVALVDEFQDTDPKQFNILELLYFNNDQGLAQQINTALYLIGDPKQAIYGFRGGDIFTYLAAGKRVDYRWLMDTNWRSSKQMISGYNHLFFGNDLGAESKNIFGFGIDYQPVHASINADKQVLQDNTANKALQFVNFQASDEFIYRDYVKSEFRPNIGAWVAAEVSRLLTDVNLSECHATEPVRAADIAILVRDGSEAEIIKQALIQLNIACVYKSQRSNLFVSAVAEQFIAVLHAIINIDDERSFIVALSGPYFGFNSDMLFNLQNDELEWERVRGQFNQLKSIWFKRGFMAMALKLLHDYYPGTKDNKERQLTNIIHLFELLQSSSQRLKQPQELLAYLKEQCQNPTHNEAELRLESDADLVQIVTQHGSKGLEYPIVFVPFGCRHKNPVKFGNTDKQVLKCHQDNGELQLHLGANEAMKQNMAAEGYAEDIRLLYVAVTRAKHRCYLACCALQDHHLSPLGQTLQLASGQSITAAINNLITYASADIGLTEIQGGEFSGNCLPLATNDSDYNPAQFSGNIERDWWLSSFSALTRNIRHAGRAQPDRDVETESAVKLAPVMTQQLIRFAFQKGAKTGNLLHDIFEKADFQDPNWSFVAYKSLSKFGDLPSGFEYPDVYCWLSECLAAPLDIDGLSLSKLARKQTLREAEFYFPMENVNLKQLKALLTNFRQSLGVNPDKLSEVSSELPAFGHLKGMMHGYIDLIFCDDNQYYLADYKSSHLGNSFADYLPENLTEHVIKNFYDLQFLIYSLALHRYLKRRIAHYQVKQHFGGVYYLYLRGMHPEQQHFQGVFHNSLSPQLLEQLDAVFLGKSSATSSAQTTEVSNNE